MIRAFTRRVGSCSTRGPNASAERWLGVFGGGPWISARSTCERRYLPFVWRRDKTSMGMGGVYREVVPGQRLVATEKFDEPCTKASRHHDRVRRAGGKTTVTTTVRTVTRGPRRRPQVPMESGSRRATTAGERDGIDDGSTGEVTLGC